MKRIKTNYPGVVYREVDRLGGNGLERVYYIIFKKDGKVFEEKAVAGSLRNGRPGGADSIDFPDIGFERVHPRPLCHG